VGEGVFADDGFVALHHQAGEMADHAAGGIDLGGFDARADLIMIRADFQGHDDFFQRGVAGALADAVDGALDLACATFHGRERIGDGHA